MSQIDPVVPAEAILENKVDLRAYPYRYLAIHCYNKYRGDGLRQVMAAAEMLSQIGFDLVNISEVTGNHLYGIMTRRADRPA